jgi:hypothetical protein
MENWLVFALQSQRPAPPGRARNDWSQRADQPVLAASWDGFVIGPPVFHKMAQDGMEVERITREYHSTRCKETIGNLPEMFFGRQPSFPPLSALLIRHNVTTKLSRR